MTTIALPLAHGIGQIQDLPIPRWLFFYAASLTLILSFVALAVLWKEPRLAATSAEGRSPSTGSGFSSGRAGGSSSARSRSAFCSSSGWRLSSAARCGRQHRDLHLGRLLARPRPDRCAVRECLDPPEPLECGCRRRRLGMGEARPGWEPAAHYPERLGALDCSRAVPRLRDARARLAAVGRAADARARDRLLQLDHLGRDADLRQTRLARKRRGVRRLLRPPGADLSLHRPGGGRPPPGLRPPAALGPCLGRLAPRHRRLRLGDARLRRLRRTERATWWRDQLYELEVKYIVESPTKADFVSLGFNFVGLLRRWSPSARCTRSPSTSPSGSGTPT